MTALFINGMYEDVLEEILRAQVNAPAEPHYLQPYSKDAIRLLKQHPPTPSQPRTLYLSLTKSLNQISYRAKIVGWRDKRPIGPAEMEAINRDIRNSHPNLEEIYLEANGKQCVNLLSIIDLEKLSGTPPTSCLIKVSDNQPLKPRTRAGSWSEVREHSDWLSVLQAESLREFARKQEAEVHASRQDTSAARQARLATARTQPESVQVISTAFRRNADVIVEVRARANGKCEACGQPAPFLRASDNEPYLEVHHVKPLARGGDDTVANAQALCPNCHRKAHFGPSD